MKFKNTQWVLSQFGIEHLERREEALPELKDNEVLIQMESVSLNYRDLLMVTGNYNPKLKLPMVPCSDGCGTIIQKGKQVTLFQEGDKVLPVFAQGWYEGKPFREIFKKTLGGPLNGTLQKYFIVPESEIVLAPKNLNSLEASTLPCAGLTAWSALVELGKVIPGETVLTLGTGGVSIFSLQIAKLLGAKVIITSSSKIKLEKAKKLGADFLIDYKETPQWEKEILKITNFKGVEHIIEVGGVGTLEKSIKCVKPGGTIYLIGVLAGRQSPVDLTPVLMQNIKIQGVIVGHKRSLEEMINAWEFHNLKPIVDQVFDFEEAPRAFEYLKNGSHFGKICIRIQ
ncbi:MAG: zinc-dependent alcohol dehydrogenase family protein [Leptonema sp. (in: bacteria)]